MKMRRDVDGMRLKQMAEGGLEQKVSEVGTDFKMWAGIAQSV